MKAIADSWIVRAGKEASGVAVNDATGKWPVRPEG